MNVYINFDFNERIERSFCFGLIDGFAENGKTIPMYWYIEHLCELKDCK